MYVDRQTRRFVVTPETRRDKELLINIMTMKNIKIKRILLLAAFLYFIFLALLLIHVDGYFSKYLDFFNGLEDTTNIKKRSAVHVLANKTIGTTSNLTVGHAIAIPLRIPGRFNTTSVVVDNNITLSKEQFILKKESHNVAKYGTNVVKDHNLSQKCLNSQTEIVVFVLSKYSHVHQRHTIRQTWAKELIAGSLNVYITILFLIGKGTPKYFSHDVETELQEQRDILIGEFQDDDNHAGPSKSDILKTLLGVTWLLEHHCYHSNLVILTAFDDFYVNLTLLHQKLQPVVVKTTILDKFWIGNVRKGLKPVREGNNPWFMSVKDYPASKLPTFCTMESGYVFSFGAAKDLHDRFKNYRILLLMDIFVGVVARDWNWAIFQDESVIPEWSQSGDICAARHQTVTRGLSSPQLTDVFSNDITSQECIHGIKRLAQNRKSHAVLQSTVSNTDMFNAVLKFSTNPGEACRVHVDGKPKQSIFLVMLISSKPEHFARRSAIRETYGKEKIIQNRHVLLLFVLGLSQNKSVDDAAQYEANIYNDMIIFGFYESHFNLTMKVIGGLKWVTEHCQEAKFMYKGDDDIFVNIDVIVAHLGFSNNANGTIKGYRSDDFMKETGIDKSSIIRATYVNGTTIQKVYINQTFRIPKERLYLGSINLGSVIFRDKRSKYYVSEKDYKGNHFPPFLSGGSYIISSDVIPALFNASFSVPIINNDDVYQGILAKTIGMRPIHYDGFRNYHTKPSGVRWSTHVDVRQLREYIWTLHGFSGEDLRTLWDVFLTSPDRSHSSSTSTWLLIFLCVVIVIHAGVILFVVAHIFGASYAQRA